MPYLLELDASNNRLSSMLNFSPPKNLQRVDLSFNNIEDMGDLSAHHYLQKLVLDSKIIKSLVSVCEMFANSVFNIFRKNSIENNLLV